MKQPLKTTAVLAMLLALAACRGGAVSTFPADVDGWRPDGEPGRYDRDTLFQYIDGAAEVYREFGVVEARTQRYARPNAPAIVADVFDMGSAENAFCAYHNDLRTGGLAELGRESESVPGALAFWKGRHFVSVLASADTPDARRAVLEIGLRLADGLPDEGEPPAALRRLPQDGLVPGRLHCFRSPTMLNRHYFLADDDVLELAPGTLGVVAAYRPAGTAPDAPPAQLLVVRYASAAAAESALAHFGTRYLHDAGPDRVARTENGRWAAAGLAGDTLIAVLDADTRERAVSVRDAMEATR